ncbi:hypothetical protein NCS56_01512600 [Fusarium sp. Ph1]|nr:hypothetical protein NCS56_01512600 [Fusarium sp. Ph1]
MTRTWVVFDNDIDASAGLKLLGRVVSDVRNPSNNFCPRISPSEPDLLSGDTMVDVRHEPDLALTLKTVRSQTAAAMLAQLFDLGVSSDQGQSFELKSARAKTLRLHQHQEIWEAVHKSHGEKIRDLARSSTGNGGLYVLVGIKTAQGPRIKRTDSDGVAHHFKANTSALENIILSSPVSTSNDLVSVELESSTNLTTAYESTVQGERAYAAEYCKVTWKAKGFILSPDGRISFRRELKKKDVVSFSKTQLSFSADSSDDESGTESDEHDEVNGGSKLGAIITMQDRLI